MGLWDLYADQADTSVQNPLTTVPRTLGERVEATAAETFSPDRYFNITGARRDMWQRAIDELHTATGQSFPNPYNPVTSEEMMRLGNQPAVEQERSQKIIEASRMARANGNDSLFDPENIDRYIGEEGNRRRQRTAMYEGTGNGFLNFLAGAAMASVEPFNVVALALPVTRLPTAASALIGETFLKNVAREALYQGATNAALQGITEGLDYNTRQATGSQQSLGEAGVNVAAAGVFGGLLGGGLRALHLKWIGLPEAVRERAPVEVKDAFRVIESETLYNGQNRLGIDPLRHERYQGRAMDAIIRGQPVDLGDLARAGDTPLTALGTVLRSAPETIRVEGVATALDRVKALPDTEIAAVLREVKPETFTTVDRLDQRAAELDARVAAINREIEQIGLADVVDIDTGARLQDIDARLSQKGLRKAERLELERERDMIVQSIDRGGQVTDELKAIRKDFFPEQQKALAAIEEERAALARERAAAESSVAREIEQARSRLDSLQAGRRFADDVSPDALAREFGAANMDGLAEAIARADMMRQARIIGENIPPDGALQQRVVNSGGNRTAEVAQQQKALDNEVQRILASTNPEASAAGPTASAPSETLAPKGTPFNELRKKAREFYRRFIGTEVKNEATGRTIKFDPTGQRKTMTGNEDMIRLVPALPELLRVAEPARVSTLDVSGDRNIIAWHYLKAIADVDGRPVPVTMAVREKKDGSFHYSMVAKREEAAGGGGFSSPEGAGKPEGLSAESPSRDVLNIVPESQVDKTELTQMRAELDAADARVKDAQAAAGCAMGGAL